MRLTAEGPSEQTCLSAFNKFLFGEANDDDIQKLEHWLGVDLFLGSKIRFENEVWRLSSGSPIIECDHCGTVLQNATLTTDAVLVQPVYPGAKDYYLCAKCAEATHEGSHCR